LLLLQLQLGLSQTQGFLLALLGLLELAVCPPLMDWMQ